MAGRRLALLIGNDRFLEGSGLTPLLCPTHDIQAMEEVLADEARGQFEVVPLGNKTNQELREAVASQVAGLTGDDTLLVYYSGHGQLDLGGRLHLATANTKCAILKPTSLPFPELKEYVDHSPCQQKVIVLDCCYSGAAGAKGDISSHLNAETKGQGTYILTASTDFETAREPAADDFGDANRLGYFTKYFVEGIETGAADANGTGRISVDDLDLYIGQRLAQDANTGQRSLKFADAAHGEVLISLSGREPRKERAVRIRKLLADWLGEGEIRDRVYSQAMDVATTQATDLTAQQRAFDDVLTRLLDEGLRPGVFVDEWKEVGDEIVQPPPPEVEDPDPLPKTPDTETDGQTQTVPDPAQTAWEKVCDSYDIAEIERFLKAFPDGEFAKEARSRRDRLTAALAWAEALTWEDAAAADQIATFEAFLKSYPESPNADAARDQIKALRALEAEAQAWAQVKDSGSRRRLARFLRRYPDGLHAPDAKRALDSLPPERWTLGRALAWLPAAAIVVYGFYVGIAFFSLTHQPGKEVAGNSDHRFSESTDIYCRLSCAVRPWCTAYEFDRPYDLCQLFEDKDPTMRNDNQYISGRWR